MLYSVFSCPLMSGLIMKHKNGEELREEVEIEVLFMWK